MAVRTNRDLYTQLTALGSKRDLETYLRALLAGVRRLAAHLGPREPTPDQIVDLLTAAGTDEPADFDAASPPTQDRPLSGLPGALSILLGQIADLMRMRSNGQLADDNRYFGLDAPSGARWYNFDPTSYLECGVAGSVRGTDTDDELELVTPPAPVDDNDEHRASFGWTGLCHLLLAGQSYE